jgi:glycine cleavage system transcriptional repressor
MDEGHLIAVSAIGNDRPGIVAGVTKVLYEAGVNLEDATSTILRGHFTMTLVVRAPVDVDAGVLEERLAEVAEDLGLVVTARPVDDAQLDVPQPTHMISVYGTDRPGIVFRVTDVLARRGANVTDFTSRMIGSTVSPVYAVMLEVVSDDAEGLAADLESLGRELDVDVSIHPIEADVL